MAANFTDLELEAYLDEALSAEEMARCELAMRQTPALLQRLAEIIGRREAGAHSLGDIWRRHRLSCPSRTELGGLLLGTLSGPAADYVQFHLEHVGCRFCQANLQDLQRQRQEAADSVQTRRRRYFQSSAGYLRNRSEH